MIIDIVPLSEDGKKKYHMKVDGKEELPPVGKTGLRIRVNELITKL